MYGLVAEFEVRRRQRIGIGIADRIARLHHGEVTLLARAGGELEARVKLPLRNV